MDDAPAPRTDARVPWGLVGMLAVVLAVESSVARRDVGFTTELIDVWTDARSRAASREVREGAVLCLGDSQVKLALQPAVVGRRLGEPVSNLAVHGGQPAAAYALLRRALDAGARPRAVVVGFFPGLLASDLRINARQWPEILDADGCLDLVATARDPDLGAQLLLGLPLRSFRAREQVRGHIVAALRGEADVGREVILENRRELRANRGSIAAPAKPEFADDPGAEGPPTSTGLAWRPKPENERYVRRLLDLAARRGIAVYWVTPTISPAFQAVRERNGLDEAYARFLRRMQGEFPGLIVLDARRLGLDRSVYRDPFHLDARGAAALSASVADAIAAGDPAASRWVGLGPRPVPDPHTRPGDCLPRASCSPGRQKAKDKGQSADHPRDADQIAQGVSPGRPAR